MLFTFDETERRTINTWHKKHKKICSVIDKGAGVIDGSLTYCFTPTGIGTGITVKCCCGEEIDATNFDNW